MQNLKISLRHDGIFNQPCAAVFLKHTEGFMSRPEMAVDKNLKGLLTSSYEKKGKNDHIVLSMDGQLPFPCLYIINFHKKDLPFRYSSVDNYARRIIKLARQHGLDKVATTIQGPSAGLDDSEAMETMLTAFASELRSRRNLGKLREILFIERDKNVFERLLVRLNYLSKEGLIEFEGKDMFLKAATASNFVSAKEAKANKKLVFIAMPYHKKFDDVYRYGIRTQIKKLVDVERTDRDSFVGDIVGRIKSRIGVAELIIADISGYNPNVFFEVGYAEGKQKNILLISQNKKIPFDLEHQRCINYKLSEIKILGKELRKSMRGIL
jgi:hypothetical protein